MDLVVAFGGRRLGLEEHRLAGAARRRAERPAARGEQLYLGRQEWAVGGEAHADGLVGVNGEAVLVGLAHRGEAGVLGAAIDERARRLLGRQRRREGRRRQQWEQRVATGGLHVMSGVAHRRHPGVADLDVLQRPALGRDEAQPTPVALCTAARAVAVRVAADRIVAPGCEDDGVGLGATGVERPSARDARALMHLDDRARLDGEGRSLVDGQIAIDLDERAPQRIRRAQAAARQQDARLERLEPEPVALSAMPTH